MVEWIGVPKDITKYIGYTYIITNIPERKFYIGKKLFFSIRKLKPLKGKKNKRLVRKETDWRDYYGSCNELNADIERLGKDNFEREILSCYKTRWEWSYAELKEQVDRDVLRRKDFYNGIIRVRLPGFKKDL